MSHKDPDGESCKNYFKYGKSFPDNVRDAVCEIDEVIGSTGPTGPAGAKGDSGGVGAPALLEDILAGVNGTPNDRNIPTYVDPSGWYHGSNRYAPMMETLTISSETFIPNALDVGIYDVTYNGDCSIGNPQNLKNGRTICICLRQGAGGNHNITWDPIFHFDGGYHFLTQSEGSKDVMVGTKINDFIFSTLASDCKSSSTVLGQSTTIVY